MVSDNIRINSCSAVSNPGVSPSAISIPKQRSQDNGIEEPAVPDSPTKRSTFRVAAILAGLNLAIFIAALEGTTIAPAIASIISDFHSANGYQWIGGSYLLANAAAGPIWVTISDIWGRKPVILTSVIFFFCASIVCAKATSIEMLIIGRAFQGTAAGGILMLVLSIQSDIFKVMWCLAGGIGPVIGGALAEYNWRWIFWINLPISGCAFILLLIFLNVHNPRTAFLEGFKAIDWLGSLSIIGLTLMLLLGLDFGGTIAPWSSPKVVCLIVVGALMSLVFVYVEKRFARCPLMPLGIFKSRSNVACVLVGFAHGFVFIAAEYYIPLQLQSTKELSPLHAGLFTLPIVVGEGVMGIVAGFYIHYTGRYLELIYAGCTLMAIGTGMYISLEADSSFGLFIGSELVGGFGAGMLFAPPLIAMQNLVPQEDTATATATFGFCRAIATAMSIVIGGVVFQNGMEARVKYLLAEGLPLSLAEQYSGQEAAANVLRIPDIENIEHKNAIKEAYAWSLSNMWIMFTVVAVLGVVAGASEKKSGNDTINN
ncbi:MFS drug transporter [Pseudovirgaria hyperparasitica]|uniref:MFS drug transporter n=1 Tax=Pseudovirgaria hyperparasitica TaxID=470096 RepID=A0A6A6VXX4_9PEZI|nr:MFS drug transporter [Pseudovirgaria hyperparasitica]KAF2754679.1 MFS drug transporter [Pseudovirgaria hyperparasitica]